MRRSDGGQASVLSLGEQPRDTTAALQFEERAAGRALREVNCEREPLFRGLFEKVVGHDEVVRPHLNCGGVSHKVAAGGSWGPPSEDPPPVCRPPL